MRDYPETDQEMTDYFESMIDKLEATPQAQKLMDDLITGTMEMPPSVPKLFYPAIKATLRPVLRLNYLSIIDSK
ncbi:oxygenase MpaB family protein [Mycobacterium sp. 1164985.4]|uniref:oxygenase MpaB family protein n=1 Tax=Mycobacterium sp. 1164985.4 TaxID=1834069 RepID=UPI0026CACF50